MFGSVHVFVCVSTLDQDFLVKVVSVECSSQGAFNKVGCSKWLLFRQVAPSWSITLLITTVFSAFGLVGCELVLPDK